MTPTQKNQLGRLVRREMDRKDGEIARLKQHINQLKYGVPDIAVSDLQPTQLAWMLLVFLKGASSYAWHFEQLLADSGKAPGVQDKLAAAAAACERAEVELLPGLNEDERDPLHDLAEDLQVLASGWPLLSDEQRAEIKQTIRVAAQ